MRSHLPSLAIIITSILLVGLVVSFSTTPTSAQASSVTCYESDGGNVKERAGFAGLRSFEQGRYGKKPDVCAGNVLTEFYCATNSEIVETTHTCPHGCSNGACLAAPTYLPPSAATAARKLARAKRLFESGVSARFRARTSVTIRRFTGVRRRLSLPSPPQPVIPSVEEEQIVPPELPRRCQYLSAARRLRVRICNVSGVR